MIVDSHAHHFFYNVELPKIMKENEERGVIAIIENGLNLETNKVVLRLQEKYRIVHAALGLHPVDLSKASEDYINKTLKFIENNINNIVAIGEVGLDFYWITDKDLKEKQVKYFERILELAEKYRKPVIVHSRKAEKECIEILSSFKITAILHSFWKPKLVKDAIEHNFFISIPAFVYKDKGLQKIAKETPLDLMLTETDAPFLDPIEKRKNASWKIIYGLKTISQIKGISLEELKSKILDNFERVFLIKIT